MSFSCSGISTFQSIPSSEIKDKKKFAESRSHLIYSAQYRHASVVVKKPKFDLASMR